MTIKHNYPKLSLIEMSGITSLISHVLNSISQSNMITTDIAYSIATFVMRYNLDYRCMWMLNVRTFMGVIDKEKMLSDVELPYDYKMYLINTNIDVFITIEVAMSELLDMYVGKDTWHIWSIVPMPNHSICLRDDGDFRIADWAETQKSSRTDFIKRIPFETLGAHE